MVEVAPDGDLETDRRLTAAVESLINQVAHDIRNYAFTVGLQAELGERLTAASPEVKGHFSAVLRQVEALKGYLERLLLFGRPVTLRPTVADAGTLVRQAVQVVTLSRPPGASPLAIGVEVTGEVTAVRWDVGAVGHALGAVLDNAVRSAEPPPPVTVKVKGEGQRVTIEVCDRGAGIPAAVRDLLWMPMRVRRHGGLGLGLAIARKMVAAHGGKLALESGPAGTTVRLELPTEVAAA